MSSVGPLVILASDSPRRLDILRTHGIDPEVLPSRVDEAALARSLPSGLSPTALAQTLALSKAREVYERIKKTAATARHALIIAADTLIYQEGTGALGKPADRSDAIRMLQLLCNTSHQVITGVALIDLTSGTETQLVDTSIVHFKEYSQSDIETFLEEEPPYDKAGSYAIQGSWSKHLRLIEGDLENVMGLPFYRIKHYVS